MCDQRSSEEIDAIAPAERVRIATWLRAKALETEELLRLAADRSEGERAAWNKLLAIKTRVLLDVLAQMIETGAMPLKEKAE